jgi:hypothetical protein
MIRPFHGPPALAQPDIYLSSTTIPQGALSLIKIKGERGDTPRVSWRKKEIHLVLNRQRTDWCGFLSADLSTRPGPYFLQVKWVPSGLEKRLEIRITKKDYGVRRLTLPKGMVDLDTETLKRVRKESKLMRDLWRAPPTSPRWNPPFVRPIPGEVSGPFGRRTLINDQPRAPHSGVDLKGERGTPIKAINNGRVVLTGDRFFSGLSVVIDHGGAIHSMYFHMERILVQKGQIVKKGDVIGHLGSTGRATGPHLHWGVRVNGARVDPLGLIALSRNLEG